MKLLTLTEQMYLSAILSLDDDAYGVKIREQVIALTGRSMVFGTLYNSFRSAGQERICGDQKGCTGMQTVRKCSTQ